MTPLQITIPTIFAVAAIVLCFFRRMPSCLVAYAAYVSAGLLGVMRIPIDQYLIWGFICMTDTVNIYSTRLHPSRTMQLYTVIGCLAGFLIGITFGTGAVLFVGGALGAIIGFLAFTRTPRGRSLNIPVSHKLSLFAESACTAWFTLSLVSIVLLAIFA